MLEPHPQRLPPASPAPFKPTQHVHACSVVFCCCHTCRIKEASIGVLLLLACCGLALPPRRVSGVLRLPPPPDGHAPRRDLGGGRGATRTPSPSGTRWRPITWERVKCRDQARLRATASARASAHWARAGRGRRRLRVGGDLLIGDGASSGATCERRGSATSMESGRKSV